MTDYTAIMWPFIAVFGGLLWLMIFLQTDMHFPKMDRASRLRMSITNASVLTAVLLGAVILFMYFILANVLHFK
jgi:hypothetical protein